MGKAKEAQAAYRRAQGLGANKKESDEKGGKSEKKVEKKKKKSSTAS
jgi:hypothetical protein